MSTNKLIEGAERYISEYEEWVSRGYNPSEYTLKLNKRIVVLAKALHNIQDFVANQYGSEACVDEARQALRGAEEIE